MAPGQTYTPEQIAAKEAQADLNEDIAFAACITQLVFLGVFFLFVVPRAAHHLAGPRFRQGWSLKRNVRAAKAVVDPSSTTGKIRNSLVLAVSGQVYTGQGEQPPRPASSVVVSVRYYYNRFMLRTLPLIDLTVGQFSVLVLYAILCTVACVDKVGSWKVNPRRFGYVGTAQIPATFIFAMKNNPVGLIGKGYEKLNYLHRFAGRLFLLFGIIHGAYYYNSQIKRLGHISLEGTVLNGTVAIVAISVMFLTGLKPVRARIYQVFLTCHILGYITVIVALWMHVEANRPYLIVALCALGADHLLKFLKARFRSARFEAAPGGLTKIEVDRLGDGWRAGQHVHMRMFNGGRFLEKHPFTIANAPGCESADPANRKLMLVARRAGDFTKSMHTLGAEEDEFPTFVNLNLSEKQLLTKATRLAVMIEGPYGGMGYNDFADHESVVLVAGGSGYTFCNSILEALVGAKKQGKAVTRHILVIWSLRDLAMVDAFADSISQSLRVAKSINLDVAFRVHVTTSVAFSISPVPELTIVQARPDVRQALSEAVDLTVADIQNRGAARGSGVGLGVCGPVPLVKAVRAAAGSIDAHRSGVVGGIVTHSEMFGW